MSNFYNKLSCIFWATDLHSKFDTKVKEYKDYNKETDPIWNKISSFPITLGGT